jgi:hypothetical protein
MARHEGFLLTTLYEQVVTTAGNQIQMPGIANVDPFAGFQPGMPLSPQQCQMLGLPPVSLFSCQFIECVALEYDQLCRLCMSMSL